MTALGLKRVVEEALARVGAQALADLAAVGESHDPGGAGGLDPARPAGDGAGFVTREDLRWVSHLATAAQAAGRRKLAAEHYETVLAGCEARGDVAGQIMCWKGLAALAEGKGPMWVAASSETARTTDRRGKGSSVRRT